MTKHSLKIAAIVSATLAVSSAAHANLIVNGDFEAGADASTIIPNWSVTPQVQTNTSADYRNGAGGTGDTGTGQFAAFGGGNQAGGTLSQSFATIAGTDYQLSFSYGAFGNGPSQQIGANVSVGALSTTVTTAASTNNLSTALKQYSFLFRANQSPTTLTFSDLSSQTNNVDGLLDNVSVNAVPEPVSLALLGVGLAGVGFLRRRNAA